MFFLSFLSTKKFCFVWNYFLGHRVWRRRCSWGICGCIKGHLFYWFCYKMSTWQQISRVLWLFWEVQWLAWQRNSKVCQVNLKIALRILKTFLLAESRLKGSKWNFNFCFFIQFSCRFYWIIFVQLNLKIRCVWITAYYFIFSLENSSDGYLEKFVALKNSCNSAGNDIISDYYYDEYWI